MQSDDIFKILLIVMLMANGQDEGSVTTRFNELLIMFMLTSDIGSLSGRGNSGCRCNCCASLNSSDGTRTSF